MHTIQQQLAPHTARTRIPAQQQCRFSRTPRFRLKSVNYYDVLEVDAEADLQEIKTAFRQKAKQLHPDVNQAPGKPLADEKDCFGWIVRLSTDAAVEQHTRPACRQ